MQIKRRSRKPATTPAQISAAQITAAVGQRDGVDDNRPTSAPRDRGIGPMERSAERCSLCRWCCRCSDPEDDGSATRTGEFGALDFAATAAASKYRSGTRRSLSGRSQTAAMNAYVAVIRQESIATRGSRQMSRSGNQRTERISPAAFCSRIRVDRVIVNATHLCSSI